MTDKTFLSLRKSQGFLKLCAQNRGQRPAVPFRQHSWQSGLWEAELTCRWAPWRSSGQWVLLALSGPLVLKGLPQQNSRKSSGGSEVLEAHPAGFSEPQAAQIQGGGEIEPEGVGALAQGEGVVLAKNPV